MQQQVQPLTWRDETPSFARRPVLPRGQGRSYGDSCLNEGGVLLTTRALDRFISFDEQTGVLRCEAGVTLGAILEVVVPRGFFLPVLPGTKHVSVGGAIANDIHGKNHHRAGTFGRHVKKLELMRSDGSRRELEPGNPLFAATIAGLGLTGLITWAEVQLRRVPGPCIRTEAVPFDSLEEFLQLTGESDANWEYTVAWIDSTSRSPGRGVFLRGEHSEGQARRSSRRLRVPVDLPAFTLNRYTVRAFNRAYRWATRRGTRVVHYDPFFFPLDSVQDWNRIYGRPGFFQFQCVVPEIGTIESLLTRVARTGNGSFLTVLKTFGDIPSPGMLSFPRKGFTLTLDFANRGAGTLALLEELEREIREASGALYPAKDARMSRATFLAGTPRLAEFEPHVDPAFSSSFWRRVSASDQNASHDCRGLKNVAPPQTGGD
ncbi:MAG TPA: FAD-binding oxidoreductase [Myxococcales bacterium]|nr:FAD-binding oxidoreductase [Myxococcales bacterium]